ncbi:hypothetical protein HZU77_016595, partial [Neisseriaceae bacterium TC5R-5]|nr:hypothetical protein [Neisseriaceae bacterium TC5R-5]
IKIYSETLQSHAPISINPAQSLGLSPRGTPAVAVHDERFEMQTPSGEPLSHVPYQLDAAEHGHLGLIGEQGETPALYTPEQQPLDFKMLWDQPIDQGE